MAHQHYKIYKPFGLISQMGSNNIKEKRTKRFISELYDFVEGSMAIGRLDEKSEGLLLMTTDGKLSDTVNRSGIEKEYYAQLDGSISPEAIEELQQGVEIGIAGKKYRTKPCAARLIKEDPGFPKAHPLLRVGTHRPNSWLSVTLTEGKFRQVRKMTAAVGFPTLRLVRVRIGSVTLQGMNPSDVIDFPDMPAVLNLE
ncbi:pseudouridine synthase [Zobellia galactanivorans]|uniref:Pseudouridine synthase n=1 Tax=Zobellia galactanivorans (strain DSM 12802 / CCUG 47099 / CIP 106680 / NCIMB 13871 / Dsij) TaxID=63186 RepID=G0L315_ZOBGA|nr:pseudouridine synthase [Zobellia galactanivorans]CAZ98325.1 Ribosomal large subunit pseudouridine synthase E [Zobellia galactanivorans]